ncbi:cupin domain-containing protein [Streptomyces sp. NPDC049879]|uniref:cupin domain-containing protein n=1 Tax=Streptomyces sp. NPDC049879 TaxID=3365598 RepID=UPI0037BBF683
MQSRRTPTDVLARMDSLLGEEPPARSGAVWRLSEGDRQLDANVIRLAPGTEVPAHVEPDVDVLLYVVGGGGRLRTDEGAVDLSPGSLVALPRGTSRALSAGAQGMAHLTVHRRRQGLSIRQGPSRPVGGVPSVAAAACAACGRRVREADALYCARCGTALPTG